MALKEITPSRWPHDTPPYRQRTEAQKIADNFEALFDTATGALLLPVFTVATAPNPVLAAGAAIYVSNGDAGSPCVAVSNGTNWLVVALGSAIATE